MNTIHQLKSILTAVIVFSLVIIGIMTLSLCYGLITGNLSRMNMEIGDSKIDSIDVGLFVVILFVVLGYAFFMYAIYQLKNLVSLFIARNFFSDCSVKTLSAIGSSLLLSSFLIPLPLYLYTVFSTNNIPIKLGALNPESTVFSFIIALFFLILSAVFKEAQTLKEENELTI